MRACGAMADMRDRMRERAEAVRAELDLIDLERWRYTDAEADL